MTVRIPWALLLPTTLALLIACGDKDDDDEEDDTASGETDADGDGFPEGDDCDDDDATTYPGADELCDGVDNDCDDEVDEDATDATAAWADADADGYGDPGAEAALCEETAGFVDNSDDCDDTEPAAFPGNPEVCDGVDNDCNDEVDDAPTDGTPYFLDADADGYGDATDALDACDLPDGRVEDATDCDDTDPAVNPAAVEACNGIDDDCDTEIDEAGATGEITWYADADADGYGDASDAGTLACDAPSGTLDDNTDCDDGAAGVNPGAAELCDGVDTDCDASTSEDGMVTFTDSAGTSSDVSADFTGAAGSPATVTLADAGTYLFCDGTYYADVEVEADVTITSLASGATFDGSGSHSIFNVETDAITLTLDDVVLQNGSGDGAALSALGFSSTGGGVNCVASADIALTDVRITASTGDLGGGIAADGCDITMMTSDIDTNSADYGGGLMVANGTLTATDSTISDNETTVSGAGAYVYYSTSTFDETVVQDNVALGGAGVLLDVSDLTCIGSTTTTAGFIGNAEDGDGGGGIQAGSGGGSTITATDCDFGTAAGGDDNYGYDITLGGIVIAFNIDDDATFTCDDDGCGTQATTQSGTGADDSFTPSSVYRGNAYDITGTPTIDTFGFYLGLTEACDVSFYVHFFDGTDWIVLWSDEVSHAVGTGFMSAGDVGIALEDGDEIIVGFAKSCSGTYYGTAGTAGDSYGFGDWTGDVWAETYPTYDSTWVPDSDYTQSYPYDVEVTYWDE